MTFGNSRATLEHFFFFSPSGGSPFNLLGNFHSDTDKGDHFLGSLLFLLLSLEGERIF